MKKTKIIKEDGRYLIYYDWPQKKKSKRKKK